MWFHLVLFLTYVIADGVSCEEEVLDGEFAMFYSLNVHYSIRGLSTIENPDYTVEIMDAVCLMRSDFQKYLSDYHYLSPRRSGNHDVKTALKNFQKFFCLPVTGELDEETLYQMKKPRCGVPDVDESGGRLRVKRFSTWGKWRKTDLKYYLSFGEDMSEVDQARVMAEAFQIWSAAAPRLKFTRTLSVSNADFKISFGKRKHSGVAGERKCYSDFDGKGNVLAHAFHPQDGRLHFDDDEYFTETGSWWNGSQSLIYVAVHEIGHALGLRHSDVKGTVMWPTASRGTPKLHKDDIDGIRSLYG